jgi:GH24 family phage-related lysozyme (muramidase)
MTLEENSAEFIKRFEGYAPVAMWDVNAWRIGHGSDTLTLPDGTYRKVKQGDKTTPEMAKKDLERRTQEFISRARATIGPVYWDRLPDQAKVALVSIAYNYGNITKQGMIDAARSGNMAALSQAIAQAQTDNNGINAKRRLQEASLVQSAIALAKIHPRITIAVFVIAVLMIIAAILLLIYRKKIAGSLTKM